MGHTRETHRPKLTSSCCIKVKKKKQPLHVNIATNRGDGSFFNPAFDFYNVQTRYALEGYYMEKNKNVVAKRVWAHRR